MSRYGRAAGKARDLLRQGAAREELLPAVNKAMNLAPAGQVVLWAKVSHALERGLEVRDKQAEDISPDLVREIDSIFEKGGAP